MTESQPPKDIIPLPEMTPEEQEQFKKMLQMFEITANDTPQQMFEKLFNPKEPLQMTIFPQRTDVTHALCLGAVDQITRPAFYEIGEDGKEQLITEVPSLAKFLYDSNLLGLRSYKGTFPAIFKEIFLNNAPNEMNITPVQLPNAIPQSPKRSTTDKLLGRNKE